MKKRILAVLVCLCLTLTVTPFTFSAAAEDPFTIEVSKAEYSPADSTVTVTVSARNNPGISALQLNLAYDSSAMSLDREVEIGELLKDGDDVNGIFAQSPTLDTAPYALVWGSAGNVTGDGVLFTVTFAVSGKDSSVDLTVAGCINQNNEELTPTVVNGSVTNAFKVRTASLTLYSDISINFKVLKTGLVGCTEPYVVVSGIGSPKTIREYEESGKYYVFSFDNIAPDKMNDTVTAVLYATAGGEQHTGAPYEYGVARYCYNMLNKSQAEIGYDAETDALFRTLLVDLLNYGAASQVFTGYNDDALASAALTPAQAAYASPAIAEINTVKNLEYAVASNPEVTKISPSLYLTNAVAIRFKVLVPDYHGLTVKVTANGKTTPIEESEFELLDDGSGFYAYYDKLNAAQMKVPVYMTVYRGDTVVSNTVQYSIESYVNSMQSSPAEGLSTLVLSMMKYGNAAYAFTN